MTLYNVVAVTATTNGEWKGAVTSPTLVLDSTIQGIVSSDHAERIVTQWLRDAGLQVSIVSALARSAEGFSPSP